MEKRAAFLRGGPFLFAQPCGILGGVNPGHPLYLDLFLGTIHEFTIKNNDRGELWACRAANMSRRGKKAFITVTVGACAGHSYMDLIRAHSAISPTARHG